MRGIFAGSVCLCSSFAAFWLSLISCRRSWIVGADDGTAAGEFAGGVTVGGGGGGDAAGGLAGAGEPGVDWADAAAGGGLAGAGEPEAGGVTADGGLAESGGLAASGAVRILAWACIALSISSASFFSHSFRCGWLASTSFLRWLARSLTAAWASSIAFKWSATGDAWGAVGTGGAAEVDSLASLGSLFVATPTGAGVCVVDGWLTGEVSGAGPLAAGGGLAGAAGGVADSDSFARWRSPLTAFITSRAALASLDEIPKSFALARICLTIPSRFCSQPLCSGLS